MGLVTAQAAAGGADFRVIGVHVSVTLGAGLLGTSAHVVRSVAIGALLMSLRLSATQHGEVLVARAARRGFVLGEIVRTMAPHALLVTAFE
jgi:hypothetical protein